MTIDKIVPQVKAIITDANKSNDIDRLIGFNMRLSGYLFYIQESESMAHEMYLDYYNARKSKEAMYVIEQTGSVNRLEKEAIVDSTEIRSNESKAEVNWNRLKGYRNTISQFIDVIQQKVAYLRREKELTNKQ